MNEVDSSKKAVEDMMFYYLFGLIRNGVQDPKQVIATEIAEMINLTEEQLDYVKVNTAEHNNLIENLDCSIELLSNIEQSKKLDLESIKIVKGILLVMKEHAKEPLSKYFKEDD
jgi:hypothetical protein